MPERESNLDKALHTKDQENLLKKMEDSSVGADDVVEESKGMSLERYAV
jgi:hypothetical protein